MQVARTHLVSRRQTLSSFIDEHDAHLASPAVHARSQVSTAHPVQEGRARVGNCHCCSNQKIDDSSGVASMEH